MATLDVGCDSSDCCEEGDEADSGPEPWGWLFPQNKSIIPQDLVREEYTFGRGEECDYHFESQNGKTKTPHYMALSNMHFRLFREKDTHGDSYVLIEDRSSNGTFVNGEKIGRNKKRVLNNDDEISLAFKNNRVFMFYDSSSSVTSSQPLPQAFKEKYIMSKLLGRGACGEVKLAFGREKCNKFAVKVVAKKTFSVGPILGRAALEEVKIMKGILHPCIIRIQDVFDTPNTLFIVLELAEGGELFDRVVKDGKLSEEKAKLFFYQMVLAIQYLHDRGITHRDIKPENILLASNEDEALIKVTDFGLSRFVGENSLMKTLCGTPSYIAPEVIKSAGTAGYSKAIDLWSMGVILFIMLSGYPPFSDEISQYSLNNQITNARYSFPEKYWEGVSSSAIDMIKRLLTLDPERRITVSEALEHPWLRDEEVVGRAKKLLEMEPAAPTTVVSDRKRRASSSDKEDTGSPVSNTSKKRRLSGSSGTISQKSSESPPKKLEEEVTPSTTPQANGGTRSTLAVEKSSS